MAQAYVDGYGSALIRYNFTPLSKKKEEVLTMPMARYIVAPQISIPTRLGLVLLIVHYRLPRNAAAYRPHRKTRLRPLCAL